MQVDKSFDVAVFEFVIVQDDERAIAEVRFVLGGYNFGSSAFAKSRVVYGPIVAEIRPAGLRCARSREPTSRLGRRSVPGRSERETDMEALSGSHCTVHRSSLTPRCIH
jgi:hypothetical protein